MKPGPGTARGEAPQLRLCKQQNYSGLRINTFFRGVTSPGSSLGKQQRKKER